MKKLILLLFLALSACAPSQERTGYDSSVDSDYPVFNSKWGPAHKEDICMSLRGVPEHPDCDPYFDNQFDHVLLEYYGGTVALFNACDSNPNLCKGYKGRERHIRNVRLFDRENWALGIL